MEHPIPPEARQLKLLLQNRLIPLAQSGAPLVLFDAPPRCSIPCDIRSESTPPLSKPLRRKSYPVYALWRKENVNSIAVPALGCIYEGACEYDIRDTAAPRNRRWIVPLQGGTIFNVKPNTPFTANKLAWEGDAPEKTYARGLILHLRHDGVNCHFFTQDKGKIWHPPNLFLHEPSAYTLGERIMQEWRRPGETSYAIITYYHLLIFHLLRRCVEEKRYIAYSQPILHAVPDALETTHDTDNFDLVAKSRILQAQDYIDENLSNPALNSQQIALHVGLSQRHLNRLFKEHAEMTLAQCIQSRRLEKARLLLDSPGILIRDVARYCGFNQPSHFSAWFTRQQQQTPQEYRKRHSSDMS
jgi:AraC-like DNA-binding protein